MGLGVCGSKAQVRVDPTLGGGSFVFHFLNRGNSEKGRHFNWSTVNAQNFHDGCLGEG